MAEFDVDLDMLSRMLDQRWDELSNLALNPPGPTANDKDDQRHRINFWQADILFRQHLVDHIKEESGAADVTITQISAAERDRIQDALNRLNTVIQRDQVFQNTVNALTQLLTAADKVIGAAQNA